jgi:hypothetical protein
MFVKEKAMPPVVSENAAFQHARAEATARLRAQIVQDIAALQQAVNESTALVQDVRRERAAARRRCEVGSVGAPLLLDQQVADT